MNLSWNLRIVIGLVALTIAAVVCGVIYYTVIRVSKDAPIEFETFPGAQLYLEEQLGEGSDHFYYISTADPLSIESFYREREFNCITQYGTVYENAVRNDSAYIQSTCLLDRSHALGFRQFTRLIIQPARTPIVYLDNNPSNQIVGGGELTGEVVIDIQRQWGNDGLFGG